MMKQFRRILVVNRGEIAVRILRTIQEMGIIGVALASDPDRQAEHVCLADEVLYLDGEKALKTYLQGDKIITLAKAAGVDAIHPGYGFLSENADFAQACIDAGLAFIGPPPEVIRVMGDKLIAKARMQGCGVPVVPGWSGEWPDQSSSSEGSFMDFSVIESEAERIGYPVLVKAAAGGGGKGMRLVHTADQLKGAFAAAAREAKSAFGDSRVFLEKYISQPRHIEFQILGDQFGNRVHLFERECSIQRRHQKVIEETPSVALTPDLRSRMAEAAVKAAHVMDYVNAGTVEFILAPDGAFYFLEVNTRLQVEHPITEMTVHQDLVRLQIQIAAGSPLPFRQEDLKQDGHAIECRIYAEDPEKGFMPSLGRLDFFRPPMGPFIRLDSGVREGDNVTIHYDPMLAKLIVWGKDRTAAMEKMVQALQNFTILGVANNVTFLKRVIEHPDFQAGRTHTHFLDAHPEVFKAEIEENVLPVEALLAASLSLASSTGFLSHGSSSGGQRDAKNDVSSTYSPWVLAGDWRSSLSDIIHPN